MLGMIKYMKGYLRIRVWGFSPERFMNLCCNRGILLWDITRKGDSYEMCIGLKSFYQLKSIVKKTGTRVAILQRYGLPFFIPFAWQRRVFFAGCLLSIAFWIGSSYFVWDIEIEGNYQITTDLLETFLEEQNVRTGVLKDSLDIQLLEKEIRRTFPQIIWVSARMEGSRLFLQLKENDAPIVAAYKENEKGMDLTADFDGVIVSMVVRSGVPKAAIGDTVEKGAVLVEGKVPIYNEDATVREYQYVESDADIIVEHPRSFRATLSATVTKKVYTGRSRSDHYLRLGEREWGFPRNTPYLLYDTVIKESRPLVFDKLSIPFYLGSRTHREYQNWEVNRTGDEVKELFSEKLNAFLATLQEKGVQIIQKNVKIDSNGGMWVLSGDFLVQEPAGVLVETVIEPIQESQENNE